MKRTLLFSVQYAFPVIMLFICECVSAQYDQLFPPVYSTTSSPISYDILIDGIEESYYSLPEKMEHFAYGKETGESDLSAEFNTVWSDEYLALFVKVNDDTAHCISPEYWDSTDSFDYIDLYTNNTWNDSDSGGYADDAFHLRWCRGSDSAFFANENWYLKAEALEMDTFAMNYILIEDTISPRGYRIEAAIPIEAILAKGSTGDICDIHVYGFELSVGDSDGPEGSPGELENRLFWDEDMTGMADSDFDTRTFGIFEVCLDSGIPEIIQQEINYIINGNEVDFEEEFFVYGIDGKYMGHGKSFTLEKGVYIARNSEYVMKFFIK